MKVKTKKYRVIIILLLLIFSSCSKDQVTSAVNSNEDISSNDKINLSHFNHLYEEIVFKGKDVGIVHIYSLFPDYEYATEPAEGFTAVDDVARSIMMLSEYLTLNTNDEAVLKKLKMLTEFVLQMQAANGYFNNFIWPDLSVNSSGSTSIAQLNWWSFRALLGLESAYPFVQSDAVLANRIVEATGALLVNIKRDIPINNLSTEIINGIELPTWLPQKYAADQSALLILGLLKTYERTGDNELKLIIDALAEGLMVMQKGDADNYPYGAFLSWDNLWHAWGNNQAYSLLKAGQRFNNQEYIDSALREIDNFYPYLLKNGFAESLSIKSIGTNSYEEINQNKYPQIAYGLRPMILAASEAYHYTKDDKYFVLSKDLEAWLWGNNDANTAIYYSATGISFDGIDGTSQINKNSGAESTIESLLILLAIEKLN
tara:strand:- start:96 stop:1385 length:1290 start_codon:yes stop_codon:yes gene_type:complete